MGTVKKIITAFEVQLVCPVCSDGDVTQPMAPFGDFPESLFCPHCDLSISLSTPWNIRDFKYAGHRVGDFLKRKEKEKS